MELMAGSSGHSSRKWIWTTYLTVSGLCEFGLNCLLWSWPIHGLFRPQSSLPNSDHLYPSMCYWVHQSHFHPSALGACPSVQPVCSSHRPITATVQRAFPIMGTFSCLPYLTELAAWNDPASCFRNLDSSLLLGRVHAFSPRGAHITGPGGRRAEPVNTLIVGIQDGTMLAQEKGNERSLHLNATAQFSSTGAFSYQLPLIRTRRFPLCCDLTPLQSEDEEVKRVVILLCSLLSVWRLVPSRTCPLPGLFSSTLTRQRTPVAHPGSSGESE